MNYRRRSQGSARRKAEAAMLKELETIEDTPSSTPKPLIDSKTTLATPAPYDEHETEETLP